MVVHPVKGVLCLTLQTDHAQACAELAAAWGNERFAAVSENRDSVLRATRLHDAGWAEWERQPVIRPESGRPYSFLDIPQVVHTEIYTRGVAAVRADDPYAALLVSLHGAGLYNGRYGHLPQLPVRPPDPGAGEAIVRFLTAQAAVQAEILDQLRPDLKTLWTYYRWLQAWDAMTLMAALFDAGQGPTIPIGPMPCRIGGADAPILAMHGTGPDTWRVEPWPFAGDELELTWPVRYVPDRAYASDEEFREALRRAPWDQRRVRFVAG